MEPEGRNNKSAETSTSYDIRSLLDKVLVKFQPPSEVEIGVPKGDTRPAFNVRQDLCFVA